MKKVPLKLANNSYIFQFGSGKAGIVIGLVIFIIIVVIIVVIVLSSSSQEEENSPKSQNQDQQATITYTLDGQQQTTESTTVKHKDLLRLENQYGDGSYLDTRNSGCESNILCVSTSTQKDRDSGSGRWMIRLTSGDGNIQYGDIVTLQNQYNKDGIYPYLDTRNSGCENNILCVSASESDNRASNSGYWKIESPSGKTGDVEYNDIINLKNQWGDGSYLDTRNSGCESNKYCVSTSNSNNRDGKSGYWKIVGI